MERSQIPMVEKIKVYLDKAKAVLKKVPRLVYIALVLLVLFAAGFVIWLNSRPYEVLFTELSATELSSILNYLEDHGVTKYQVQNNDTILVPQDQEADLKVRLLMEGYPQSGYAYAAPTETGMLSTQDERDQATLDNLQNRLSATVSNFDGVREAVVTINTGEDSSFVLDSSRTLKATASVFLTMKESGKLLSDEKADAIRNLIAHSVKGLEVSSVSITDGAGNSYNSGGASVSDSEASALKIRLEEQYENKVRSSALQVLIPYFSEEGVRVGVNCTVDVSQTVEDLTEVYLPDYALDGSTYGEGIVGSRYVEFRIIRDGEETTGGTVGTTTNSDFPEYLENLPQPDGSEREYSFSGQTDMDNSRKEQHVVRIAGELTDCTISVSIDEEYVSAAMDIDEIIRHVARACGIQGTYDEETGEEYLEDRIHVMIHPFYKETVTIPIPTPGPVEAWVLYAAGAGLLLFILLLVLILVIRRKRKKKKKAKEEKLQQENYQDINAFLAAAAAYKPEEDMGADVMSMQSERSIELRKDIRKFAEDNPEIAAQMLRGWLRGADENG